MFRILNTLFSIKEMSSENNCFREKSFFVGSDSDYDLSFLTTGFYTSFISSTLLISFVYLVFWTISLWYSNILAFNIFFSSIFYFYSFLSNIPSKNLFSKRLAGKDCYCSTGWLFCVLLIYLIASIFWSISKPTLLQKLIP